MAMIRFGTTRPAVVLLHSSASSARQWDALIRALEPRFRVFAVDLHGHGAKPDWSGDRPLRLADDAALVEPLLDGGGVHVVGHSYGAAVALKVAALYPRRVHSVVAFEPVAFRLLTECARFGAAQEISALSDAIQSLADRGELDLAAQRFVDFWARGAAWGAMSPGRRDAVAARMPAVLQHFGALMREPLFRPEQLSRLDVPLLFLEGQRTVVAMQSLMELLRSVLPAARHEALPNAGHMGPITDAEAVNRRVVEFLTQEEAMHDIGMQPLVRARQIQQAVAAFG
jgi:pimeloyl-ACP methyl ester carboxylesterase